MAVRKYTLPQLEANYIAGNAVVTYYYCDTAAEIPASGYTVGDIVFAADSFETFVAKSATVLQGVKVAARTSDPSSPSTGEMWLRTDL